MQWLYPAGAWALLSLAVITALYLLKRQSVQRNVPSLLLWQRAAADQTASRPFQKLKKNILYFLRWTAISIVMGTVCGLIGRFDAPCRQRRRDGRNGADL